MPKQCCRVNRPSVYMHVRADSASEVCDELPYGTPLMPLAPPVPAKNGGGCYVRCETDYGYSGYVHEKYMISDSDEASDPIYRFRVTAPFCDLLADSVYRYRPILTVPRGSVLLSRKEHLGTDRFFPVTAQNRTYFVPTAALRPFCVRDNLCECSEDAEALRKQICDDALFYLGTPYRWGGRTPAGIDCSGLCFTAYALNGIRIWRDAFADTRYVHEIGAEQLLPGDLIYFNGHVALYIGDGEYVHSSASAGGVTVNSLTRGSIIYREDLAKSVVCYARSNLL